MLTEQVHRIIVVSVVVAVVDRRIGECQVVHVHVGIDAHLAGAVVGRVVVERRVGVDRVTRRRHELILALRGDQSAVAGTTTSPCCRCRRSATIVVVGVVAVVAAVVDATLAAAMANAVMITGFGIGRDGRGELVESAASGRVRLHVVLARRVAKTSAGGRRTLQRLAAGVECRGGTGSG